MADMTRRFQNNFDKFLRIAMDLLLKRLSWNLGQKKANRAGARNKISKLLLFEILLFSHRQYKKGVLGKIENQCIFKMATTSYYISSRSFFLGKGI